MKKIIAKIISPERVIGLLKKTISGMESKDALRYLFTIDRGLYSLEGQTSVRYGRGVHTKHRHINYHQFFISNLKEGQKVLDIGCGNGVLDKDMADHVADIKITGIELTQSNYEAAVKNNSHPNIQYINADALTLELSDKFNVIILSNVLEHIEDRINFLKRLAAKYRPEYFLIRVPMYERDWRIPLQQELGLDYFLDATHYIEYRFDELESELGKAGLKIETIKTNWGEYWLKAVPDRPIKS